MSTRHGPAFGFWLDYLESHGGLWEPSGDTVLAVLPEHLSAEHDLPETATITDDPDAAREDGALFLGAGHPEIGKGADTVIGSGDVGVLTVGHTGKSLSTEDLLVKIRDLVPVDHGRIDATGSVLRSHRPALRLGALAAHVVSADEQFTDVVDCLVDVPSRVPWSPQAADRVQTAAATPAPRPSVPRDTLAAAAAAAHRELEIGAARRVRALAGGAEAERTAEAARASEYYAAALATIERRRDGADPKRRALLDSRARATEGERDRRLAEIDEKYRPHHELRPYRLHLVELPVLRLATDVRRGERRWPVTFDYLPLLGAVAPTRCPACDAHSPLVATKTHLGCATCVPARPSLRPAPSGARTAAGATEEGAVAPATTGQGAAAPRTTGQGTAAPGTAGKGTTAARATRSGGAGAGHARRFEDAAGRGGDARSRPTSSPETSTPQGAAARAPRSPSASRRAGSAPTVPVRGPARTGPFLPGRPQERAVIGFWNHVAAGDTRKVSRLVEPSSPLAALVRLYGSAGPLRGIGVDDGRAPESFTCGNYDTPVAGNRGGTAGAVHTRDGEHPYLLLWSLDRRLEEIYPYSGPWHLGRSTMFRSATVDAAPSPAELDVVAQLLLSHTSARHGLTFAARALAAWWRFPDPDALLARFEPRVLAGALDRAVCYWSGAVGTGYRESAAVFRADEADLRKVTPVLQKHLQLSSTRTW